MVGEVQHLLLNLKEEPMSGGKCVLTTELERDDDGEVDTFYIVKD